MGAAPEQPRVNKWLVTISVTFGTLMGSIDSSIVNVALPQIRGAVGATVQEVTWISTGFAIASVIVMPLTAFLGHLFGQKRLYLACLLVFLVGSTLCGVAQTLPQLVAFRAIQGFGAGALQPTEQAILRQTFSRREQGTAMALFGMAVMVGPAVGPTLGGAIVDHLHWSWIFFINLPVGALGLFMVWRFVHEQEDIRAAYAQEAVRQRGHMDWPGIALLAVGLSALQYVLEEGQRRDWFDSGLILGCAVTAGVALAAFVGRELTAAVPAVNLRLFRDRLFTAGMVVTALMYAVLMGCMFLLPLFMQEVLGFTAMQSGLALMPRVLVMMVATPIVGVLCRHVSPRALVAAGACFVAYGSWTLSHVTLATTSAGIIHGIMIQGLGFSLLFVPITATALSNIPRAQLGDGTGLNALVRQVGGSFGLAVFTTLLERYGVRARAAVSSHLSADRPEVQERLARLGTALARGGLDPSAARAGALRKLAGVVARQGTVLAFERILLLTGLLMLAVIPALVFLKVRREPARVAAEV